jgi:type I restriction enzyme S subunit
MNNYQLSVKSYPVYKDSGVAWLGDVPEHWEVRRVKDIGVNGLTNGLFKKKEDFGFGVKLINVSDLYQEDNIIKYDCLDRVNANEDEINRYSVVSGDIFFVRSSLKLEGIGISSLLEKPEETTVFECHIIRFSPNTKLISPKFLKYLFNSKDIKLKFILVSKTVTMTTISQEKISSIELAVPPLSEQKSIATYLDTKTAQCDRKIDLLTQKATKYGKLKQSLINETVTRGLDKSVPMKDSDYEWNHKIPTSWKETRVKNIFKLVTDLAPNDNNFELLSLFASIGVKPRKDMEQRGNKSVTTDGYWMVKKGDIIVNKLLAWMGSIGLSDYDGVTSPAYDILRKSSEKVDQRFYTYLFRTEIAQAIFKKQSRGIMDVRLRLYFDKFGAISVPFPPPEEQKAIADYLDTKTAQIDQIIQTINTQIEKLKELRKTLINDVVTGKIRV